MRHCFVGSLLLAVALSSGACGGSVGAVSGPDTSGADGSTDAGAEAGADSSACPVGSYPIECNGVVLYCCPPGAHCDPPSCGSPDAGDAAAAHD
jgi:hypothetical protein